MRGTATFELHGYTLVTELRSSIGIWDLEFFWSLEFGVWSFSGAWLLVLGASSNRYVRQIKSRSKSPSRCTAPAHSLVARFDHLLARDWRSILGAVVFLWQTTAGSKHRARECRRHQFSIAASLVPFLFAIEMENPSRSIGSSPRRGPSNARGISHPWSHWRSGPHF